MSYTAAFFDELEKIAASISTLRKGLSRLGVKAPPKGIPYWAFSAPTKAQYPVMKSLRGAARPELEALYKKSPGQIYLSPGIGGAYMPGATKQEAENLRTIFGLHESFERGIKPFNIESSAAGHLSPSVLLNEKNLLNRMSGAGKEKAYFEKLREPEYARLKEQVKDAFGERGLAFLEPGARVPKAMKKRFAEMKSTRSPMPKEELENIRFHQYQTAQNLKEKLPVPMPVQKPKRSLLPYVGAGTVAVGAPAGLAVGYKKYKERQKGGDAP